MSRKINKKKLFRNLILILLLVGVVGVYLANRFVKSKGFSGLGEFITNYQTNNALSDAVDPEVIRITLSETDYQFLEERRQVALDRGIQINDGENYVDCKVILDGDTTKGEMRLKGHMTDHLEGEKWSFRVKTKEEVKGMYRFSLQHPGTRNYIYEWIYHEFLKSEGIIALKYDFIHLYLNEKDLGIYAVEEHFGQHVLRDNERPPGAILRWNPELYWENRIAELDGEYWDQQASDYSSSFPEPYDRGTVKKDGELTENYILGASLLEAFRRGERSTSAVFDVEKMATFHAIIDLVGGYHSLDWSDIKFFYNAETKKIEPVGYESFSVRETTKIAGQRTPEDYSTVGFDYHDRLFADRTFFRAYIAALERICDPIYFESFVESIRPELDKKRGVLAHEFAYIKFSLDPYFENITRIIENINLPKPFHAFLDAKTDSSLTFSVAPVSDFPVDVFAVEVNGKSIALENPIELAPKARDTYTHYTQFEVPYNGKKPKDLVLQARIPGGSSIFQVSVAEYPAYRMLEEESKNSENSEQADTSVLSRLNDSVYFFPEQVVFIREALTIPEGKTVRVYAGQKLTFAPEGRIDLYGNMECYGTTDAPVVLVAEGNQGEFIRMKKASEFLGVHLSYSAGERTLLSARNATVDLQQCTFGTVNAPLMTALHSEVKFVKCSGGELSSLGVFDRSTVRISGVTMAHGDTFLTGVGSDIEMFDSSIMDYTVGVDLDYTSQFHCWNSTWRKLEALARLDHASFFQAIGGAIDAEKGFCLDIETDTETVSSYFLQRGTVNFDTKEERKS